MRTYAVSFNGNAPESWTHDAVRTDSSGEFPTFHICDIENMEFLNRAGQAMRLSDGTRIVLVEG